MPRVIEVTQRERDVIGELAADGASNKQIAERLDITVATVTNRFKWLMKRTGYASRTALAVDLLRGRVKLRVVDSLRRERMDP